MDDITSCRHLEKGRHWKMQPIYGEEVRRVRLCSDCGRTFKALLAVTGEKKFDDLAERQIKRFFVE